MYEDCVSVVLAIPNDTSFFIVFVFYYLKIEFVATIVFFLNHTNFFFTVEGDISKVLVKSLTEAHANTNPKLDYIHEMFGKPQDVSK